MKNDIIGKLLWSELIFKGDFNIRFEKFYGLLRLLSL
jgi:hypothetical protein